jgi:NAD(P)-dependent dehydrogenase (short-subunit alcohol dehydrogenase family)
MTESEDMPMNGPLEGRRALITGATAGIALAAAEGMLRAGATVTLNGRDPARLDRVAGDLRERLGKNADVRTAPGDVGLPGDIDAILQAAGQVDILVNGAARIVRSKSWLDYGDDEWIAHFQTNVLGGVRLCRQVLPSMLERGHGRVIFISSDTGVTPTSLSPYAVTKTAQVTIARSLALSTRNTSVTVNSILPGPTTGEAFTQMLEDDVASGTASSLEEAGRNFVAQARPDSLLGRPTTPAEVASLILYLVSDDAIGINGAAVRFEGGSIRSLF